MKPTPVVAGVAEHSGWAIIVCVGAKDGSPAVVDRRRVELLDARLPKQPYEHETVGMNPPDAERLVEEVRESAMHCAERAMSRLQADLGANQKLVAVALREPTLPQLPATVAEVHASPHLQARADGVLYLHALRSAASSLGIHTAIVPRGKERPHAAETLSTSVEAVDLFLSGLRASLGAPWQQDHQAATARAITELGRHSKLQLR
jgi:hypothetical protein